MAISEAARADLYTGLAEVLGPQRPEILMTHLPSFDPSEIASKADLALLRTDLASFKVDVDELFDQVDKRFDQLEMRMLGVDRRLDRFFLTLLAGMFVIVATMATVIFTVG